MDVNRLFPPSLWLTHTHTHFLLTQCLILALTKRDCVLRRHWHTREGRKKKKKSNKQSKEQADGQTVRSTDRYGAGWWLSWHYWRITGLPLWINQTWITLYLFWYEHVRPSSECFLDEFWAIQAIWNADRDCSPCLCMTLRLKRWASLRLSCL